MGIAAVIAALWLYGWPPPSPPPLAPAAVQTAPAPGVSESVPVPAVSASVPAVSAPVTVLAASARAPRPSVFRRWWFWTILGGFAAVSVATVYFTSRPSPEPYVGNLQPGVWMLP